MTKVVVNPDINNPGRIRIRSVPYSKISNETSVELSQPIVVRRAISDDSGTLRAYLRFGKKGSKNLADAIKLVPEDSTIVNQMIKDNTIDGDSKLKDYSVSKTSLGDVLGTKEATSNKITVTLSQASSQGAISIGLNCTSVEKSDTLTTPRKLKVLLSSTTDKTFDGSADLIDIPVSGTLPQANGGTGFNNYAKGDLIYAGDQGVLAKRSYPTSYVDNNVTKGAKFLKATSSSGVPDWGFVNANNEIIGILPVTNGGTGVSGSVSAKYVFAAPNGSTGSPSFRRLVSTDITGSTNAYQVMYTATAKGNPTWGKVILNSNNSMVTGILPVANGGTGKSSFTSGGIFYASSSSAISQVSNGTGVLVCTSSGSTYSYQKQLTTSHVTSLNVSDTGAVNEGTIQASNFNSTSDIRLKDNIKPYEYKKSILDLPIVSWNWKKDGSYSMGCIAQDLREIAPDLVDVDSEGFLSIKESKLVYLLLLEVKSLRDKINKMRL